MNIYVRLTMLTLLTIGSLSCKKNQVDDWSTVKKLYRIYKNGEISECSLEGTKVFSAGLNAYDAAGYIYSADGNKIGSCNFAWGVPDSICGQLKDCETIYRVEDNIWGQPAVDQYKIKNGIFR